MKLSIILLLVFFIPGFSKAQIPVSSGIFGAREYSKETAMYKAKQFVIENILGISGEVIGFQIYPLATASSGELTSFVYHCLEKNKDGLVLAFFGDYWNPSGVTFKAYGFKDIPKERALLLLDTLQKTIDDYASFVRQDKDNNNLYFRTEDMTFLIFSSGSGLKLRVFWGEFDSEWDITAFKQTKKRLLNKLNDEQPNN